ncbi:asparagine synthase (glutamine-hydrolysing) [Pseudomonas pohangensis]|uniref:asparagine synthase (glutamine-hydrolyzing) n=1 Tax=Pseudomonas pohangensis TaxID=364197 RepID=A0A1H2EKY0_9PSED|nr:asparagine synthase (glutamine-hydrolyzing) [Pseudomonas pohangensis]SDT95765.1 asparagine synthase (glutamine-hydrolysing) [Pseudomonas pohangensis]
MCGLSGFLQGRSSSFSLATTIEGMTERLIHRGPDETGVWVDESIGLALGHRRLAVLELSPAGAQPMHSAGGRFVLAFNGEIYNHLALREQLAVEGATPAWLGHSDTETLLACFERWGIQKTLQQTVGMFSIAVWDVQGLILHLARDRFGEKPLYYGWVGQGGGRAFAFASELKALRAYPGFANPISREALALYMRFTVVPAPHSIYQSIYKLEPGCLLSISADAAPGDMPAFEKPLRPPFDQEGVTLQRWWALGDVVQAGAQSLIRDETEAISTLEQRLAEAVQLQSLADVPLGAFLSGGIDSSIIVALMQQQASRPVKTFTVGFEEAGFDESPHARAVAQHLGTEHSELFVTSAQAQAVIAGLPEMYDEPFADSSQIPTHLVCKAARQQVTVALSGDAGDELFGGYNRYFWGPRIWSRLAWMPAPLRRALGATIAALPVAGWNALGRPLNALLPSGKGIARAGDKAHKLAARLHGVRDLDDLYLSLVSEWQDPAQVVRGVAGARLVEPASLLDDVLPAHGVEPSQLRMMYRDSLTYLPDDILCKVDRAAMAVSLETRVPFLDHRVAELAWQLPLDMKIRGGQGKWALRQVLYKYVPRQLIERPKAGFAIPVGEWLRGPLRDWAESLLDEQRLLTEGYFYPAPIRNRWAEHLSGRRDHTASLWAVLMFQAWLERQ